MTLIENNIPVHILDPKRPVVTTSDHHVRPDLLLESLTDQRTFELTGRKTSALEQNQWLIDSVNSDDTEVISAWAGDVVQLHPNPPHLKKLIKPALYAFTDRVVKNNITGNSLKWILGNHDPEEDWPPEVLAELRARGIVQPGNEIRFYDADNLIIYRMMHGHREQPASFNNAILEHPIWTHFFDKISTAIHTLRCRNQEWPFPVGPVMKLINLPQMAWNEANLAPGEVRIIGHTHSPALSLEDRFANTGSRDTVFNLASAIRISPQSLSLSHTNLNSSIYQPGDIVRAQAESMRVVKSYDRQALQNFGERQRQLGTSFASAAGNLLNMDGFMER